MGDTLPSHDLPIWCLGMRGEAWADCSQAGSSVFLWMPKRVAGGPMRPSRVRIIDCYMDAKWSLVRDRPVYLLMVFRNNQCSFVGG